VRRPPLADRAEICDVLVLRVLECSGSMIMQGIKKESAGTR
jgi:hypothetical protein